MPTYRGPGGEYSENPGIPIALSAGEFAKDRHVVWKRIDEMRIKAAAADPNEAHRVLAKWEGGGERFNRFLIATILDRLLRLCREATPDCGIINVNPHEDCIRMSHHYLPLPSSVAMVAMDSGLGERH